MSSEDEQYADNFWEDVVIPFQEDDANFEFANPLVVSEAFLKAIAWGAQISGLAEDLFIEISKLETEKKDIDRKIAKIDRTVLSKFYSEITKTAAPEVRRAFIQNKSAEIGKDVELDALEQKRDDIQAKLDDLERKREFYKNRMRFLEKSTEWAKQYLDYDKLLERLETKGRGTR